MNDSNKNPDTEPDAIRVFDSNGREVSIPRQQWRETILPGAILKEWDNPDGLAALIMKSLEDGLASEVIDAAIQLEDIDANMERGNLLLGLVHLENGHLHDAEKAFRAADEVKGSGPAGLANLAVLMERQGDMAQAKVLRWRALERDPNQEQAMAQYCARAEAEGGETGLLDALRLLETLPESWRAKAWLARHALGTGNRSAALDGIRAVLERSESLPAEALMEMSGELGKAGELEAMLDLFSPRFDPGAHGMMLGNNLLKASLELGRIDGAKAILESLNALQRPDWRENLAFWQAQLDNKAKGIGSGPAGAPMEIAVMPLAGPIWARGQEGFDALVPPKAAGTIQICIAAPTVSGSPGSQGQAAIRQGDDMAGLFSRSLALYLAERIHMGTTAVGTALLLGLKDRLGFVSGGSPYPVKQLLQMGRMAGNHPCPFVINAHMDVSGPKWAVALTALDTATGEEAGRFAGETDPDDPGALFDHLATRLCAFAKEKAGAAAEITPAWYAKPAPGRWPALLTARMQALVVATAAMHKGNLGPDGDRQILESLVRTATESKEDAVARLLLLTALNRNREIDPGIHLEYAERVSSLDREAPLPEAVRVRASAVMASLYPSPTSG
ncbi:MAG: hypothetical protein JWP91_1447 [Fibrobacteres bacterium]|nr:hypothetical protein [Fibrobacterota bacterium]